jgi:hypothetical protein
MTQEKGAAEINVKLKDGFITVTHRDGTQLLKKMASKGDWNKIWKALS